MRKYKLEIGNSKELLKSLPDNSIDAIVTDPPYELGFMGKKWDATGIAYDVELWTECLRVLKPGGHLLAFSGSRTYHRMTVAIEDAGFDIRDQIMWVYGSGFPKSHDVSKAIDKMAGAEREITGTAKRTPATDAAKEWNGWGTALKPAHEPICVARKPLIGTVAENVLQYGTGAFNIDGCRIHGTAETKKLDIALKGYKKGVDHISKDIPNEYGELKSNIGIRGYKAREHCTLEHVNLGRWPANLIHDGSAEVLAGFPETKGQVGRRKTQGGHRFIFGDTESVQKFDQGTIDHGSAARFFYCAKASKKDRNEGHQINNHPTVKPTELMQYLCRLVTPPNGIVLDPFTGSGSTGKAAVLEGFRFIGFDMQHEYIEIAKARIEYAIQKKNEIEIKKENTLFDE